MSRDQVLMLMGPPLLQTTQQWSEAWSYWAQPLVEVQVNKRTTVMYNIADEGTHLYFDEAGTVASVSGDYLKGDFIGRTKQDVLANFDEPHEARVTPFAVIYHYSLPGQFGSGTYQRRQVHFDADGAVFSVVFEMYHD